MHRIRRTGRHFLRLRRFQPDQRQFRSAQRRQTADGMAPFDSQANRRVLSRRPARQADYGHLPHGGHQRAARSRRTGAGQRSAHLRKLPPHAVKHRPPFVRDRARRRRNAGRNDRARHTGKAHHPADSPGRRGDARLVRDRARGTVLAGRRPCLHPAQRQARHFGRRRVCGPWPLPHHRIPGLPENARDHRPEGDRRRPA